MIKAEWMISILVDQADRHFHNPKFESYFPEATFLSPLKIKKHTRYKSSDAFRRFIFNRSGKENQHQNPKTQDQILDR
ncbi:hypothetical protein MFFC18_15050 [Mariniblastus fucicola]|uniref:Uncharacterized protein n=1 Tax=Mariniblastus fucicola TaxID=980251 RepID=A0A5B9P4W8_9BACT|nr:hypothetical protein MFFC18_15050 [Mariniblastus fucicola]